jgi:hypothetical protein
MTSDRKRKKDARAYKAAMTARTAMPFAPSQPHQAVLVDGGERRNKETSFRRGRALGVPHRP